MLDTDRLYEENGLVVINLLIRTGDKYIIISLPEISWRQSYRLEIIVWLPPDVLIRYSSSCVPLLLLSDNYVHKFGSKQKQFNRSRYWLASGKLKFK